jgi:hypothetical protein
MTSRGRPRVSQVRLKNGFYIEVCNKGVKKGIKIRTENKNAMEDAARLYRKYKDVIILGEFKDGVPFDKAPSQMLSL